MLFVELKQTEIARKEDNVFEFVHKALRSFKTSTIHNSIKINNSFCIDNSLEYFF